MSIISPMGRVYCLLSAAGFGAMAIFGKLAFDAHVTVTTLLFVRFGLAALLLAPFALQRQRARPGTVPARAVVVTAIGLGLVGYAAQAGLYFLALERMDASLLALLLYTYPAMVCVSAIALRREPPTRRKLGALALASGGVALVLGGAAGGGVDPLGVVMALGAAATYTGYILVSDGVVGKLEPLVLSTLVCAGAATTFLVLGTATGQLRFTFDSDGWLWLACIAGVSTVLPVVAFFAGLARVGPSSAAILSTFEPPVTVTLAFLAFGEQLGIVQLSGALFVLGAVVLVSLPGKRAEFGLQPAVSGVPSRP